MSALEKVLLAAGSTVAPVEVDPDAELLLAAQVAARELAVLLASDPDDDGDDDSSGQDGGPGDDDDDAGHTSHATFKALKQKGVPDAKAAQMCAKADKKVKACQLADSLGVILSGQQGTDISLISLTPASETASGRRKAAKSGHALPDGTYPIEDKKHLHKAAVLAASGHGDAEAAKRLIRKRARELGVDVSTLPGFGGDSDKDKKVAASVVALAAGQMKGTAAQAHPPFHGVHAHPHVHKGDNYHGPGPDHMPGQPSHGAY